MTSEYVEEESTGRSVAERRGYIKKQYGIQIIFPFINKKILVDDKKFKDQPFYNTVSLVFCFWGILL